MPIINEARNEKKEKLKVEINEGTLAKINEYCAWAKISSVDFFMQEAVDYLFSKDKDWKQHQKSKKSTRRKTTTATAS